MKRRWILPTLVGLVLAALVVWVIRHTEWAEVDEADPPTRVDTDRYGPLRRVLASTGSTLEVRSALQPLPPEGATLLLESMQWNLFPEADAQLRAWVEGGGHLVVIGYQVQPHKDLGWIPLSFLGPRPAVPAARPAAVPESAAASGPSARAAAAARFASLGSGCQEWREADGSRPAFEPGRVYRNCTGYGPLRATGAAPTWTLGDADKALAMRVPLGRGSVTGVSAWLALTPPMLYQADHALIDAAVLQAAPGHAIWLVQDESREPLALWLWHHARATVLLALSTIALALWRLMVRFGPREAPAAQARRSMIEQVRGTGEFIASHEPQALHAATRHALDELARKHITAYADADATDDDRVDALAARLARHSTFDRAALVSALNPGPRSTRADWLAAIALIEQTRRAVLRAPPPPQD